ncbi:MAG TPA: calcium-binding protein [Ilumatobacter sp.]|nr:calcium-binding protein [Ilumatobacter sp.]
MRRRYLFLPLGLLTLVASALAASAVTTGGQSAPPPHYEPDTTCDVDGVETGYGVEFGAPTSDYRVTKVNVRQISPTCDGGTLVVVLSRASDGVELGRGSMPLDDSGSSQVEIPNASAKETTQVRVELHGGKVPVPQPCEAAGMGFDQVTVGTTEDDRINGISRRDLLFGLPGNDTIDGLPNPDCIDGGTGNDRLRGNEGDDVLVGGEGNDDLEGDNGRDTLVGGAGDDVLVGGHGTDRCVGGPGDDRFLSCETVEDE